ncbi:Alpha/beta hydrolase family-domain-containing protein [Mycena floridula]|nr:Alpha/beta hydrolase family-domain-containing protein [Mycena floridula]
MAHHNVTPHNELEETSFVLDVRTETDPLMIAAKRYRFSSSSGASKVKSDAPVVLLFAHALGFHKEHWEPMLLDLAQLIERNPNSGLAIAEAWAMDCQDHGDSAIVNEHILSKTPKFVSCYDYGRAFVSLIQSSHFANNKHCRIVLVGHSAGCASLILASSFFPTLKDIPFDSYILVEPAMIPQRFVENDREVQKIMKWIVDSNTFKSRAPWNVWDQRVLDIYVNQGLRKLPTAVYPEARKAVTLKTPKLVEGTAYGEPHIQYEALARLSEISRVIPIHAIFGDKKDYLPLRIQQVMFSDVSIVSTTFLPGVGHMIVEESPQIVAEQVFKILANSKKAETPRARL